jgi:hypothetical protein
MSWAIGATLRRRVGALANGTEVWIRSWSEDDPDRVEVAPCWGWRKPVWCDLADLEAFAVLPDLSPELPSGPVQTWTESLQAQRVGACLEQAAIEARQALAAAGHGRIPRRRGA